MKLTITRIGEPKTINYTDKKTGKPASFQKVGFQCQEFADRWHDLSFRGSHGLEIGKCEEFELKSREYNGKTYWDAQRPKKEDIAASEISALKTTVGKLNFKVEELEICIKGLCHKLGLDIKDLRALADEAARGYKYPVNNLPEATFEQSFTTGDIDPENIPF